MSTENSVSTAGSSKSRVWCQARSDELDPLGFGILPVTETGFVHLGGPVGSLAFIEQTIMKRIEKVRQLLDKLPALENPHSEFVLRSCFALRLCLKSAFSCASAHHPLLALPTGKCLTST